MSPPILVVENEEDLAQSYERLLRRQGYRVVWVGTRAGGLLAVEREPPRLLIADLALPDGDGLDVVRSARRLPRPAPAIVVTAFASEAARRAALDAGAADVLVKPFATDAFLSLVHRVLEAS